MFTYALKFAVKAQSKAISSVCRLVNIKLLPHTTLGMMTEINHYHKFSIK